MRWPSSMKNGGKNMNLETKYIVALANLYGIVHPNKVIEIYNLQNTDNIVTLAKYQKRMLKKEFVYFDNGYFISANIREYGDDFINHIQAQENNKFYVLEKEELLKYIDYDYIEMNEQYSALIECLRNVTDFDEENLSEFIYFLKLAINEDEDILPSFADMVCFNSSFESEKIVIQLLEVVIECAGHTRMTINNGYTQIEAYGKETDEISKLRKEINELCKCDSNKLYKDCCLITYMRNIRYNNTLNMSKNVN